MRKILILTAILALTACETNQTLETAINEIPPAEKMGCYTKKVTTNSTLFNTGYEKEACFCTKKLPKGSCFRCGNGAELGDGCNKQADAMTDLTTQVKTLVESLK